MSITTTMSLDHLQDTEDPQWDFILVYTDWLEDQGDVENLRTAEALRHLVAHQRWPAALNVWGCEFFGPSKTITSTNPNEKYCRIPSPWLTMPFGHACTIKEALLFYVRAYWVLKDSGKLC